MTKYVHKRTIKYMNVTEFRKDISKHLDAALKGQKVVIERGGVTYQLFAYIDEMATIDDEAMTRLASIVKHKPNTKPDTTPPPKAYKETPAAYCEHGQVKGTCLWKGCKYGK